ncbi:hypothetical protein AB0X39_19650 [Escherichia coli]
MNTFKNKNTEIFYIVSLHIYAELFNSKDKTTSRININPYKIREGFFLIGFDYRDITNGERLHVASNKDGHEYFNKCLKNSSRVWMQ